MAISSTRLLGLATSGFDKIRIPFKLQPTYDNPASAIQYVDQTDNYLAEELRYGVLYGPFKELPFPVHMSSLLTRATQNSDKCHTIMDLSWPKGASINNAIHKFLEQYNSITYFDNKAPDHTVHLDASMAGMGAIFRDMVYTLPIPSHYQHLHITQLEKLNVVVALKVLASLGTNKIIDIRCDNPGCSRGTHFWENKRYFSGHLCQKRMLNTCHI